MPEDVYFPDQYENSEFAPTNRNEIYEEWDSTASYNSGDVVSVTTLNGDSVLNPPTVYVCMGSVSIPPIKR